MIDLSSINYFHLIIILIMCHLFGDYVLQSNFIAQTKGDNIYHLIVHCALYTLPFLIIFGFVWQTLIIFIMHLFVDPLKAQFNKITYLEDQVIHYVTLFIYFL